MKSLVRVTQDPRVEHQPGGSGFVGAPHTPWAPPQACWQSKDTCPELLCSCLTPRRGRKMNSRDRCPCCWGLPELVPLRRSRRFLGATGQSLSRPKGRASSSPGTWRLGPRWPPAPTDRQPRGHGSTYLYSSCHRHRGEVLFITYD